MLYTGQGDGGFTRLIGGAALPKCDRRLETIGALDEAQAHLGLARASFHATAWAIAISRVQADLRLLMAELAAPGTAGAFLEEAHTERLEADLHVWDAPFQGFISPGEGMGSAHLHVARTVIRRAERQAVGLAQAGEPVNPRVITYLNRLSSWLFALALQVDAGEADTASIPITSVA
ncbi:MAG: Cob(I)yrinic acid a,c-diamide adenosyltransferase [bacterium ADurb.Bin429]|nr:MAG: Cob(I)yrinic acid a,c-diamide adenosyltransferase [bacterium ADurb.Bin429]